MKKYTVLLVSIFFIQISCYSQYVYICTGQYAKVFHSKTDCNGLGNCKSNIILITESQAKNTYNLQRACCICMSNRYGCGTEDLPTAKFNPYVPQTSLSPAQIEAGRREAEKQAAAYAAVGALAVGAIAGSNDFYFQYFQDRATILTPMYGMVVNDIGIGFGFRKIINKSFFEYGASVITQTDYVGEDGGYPKWGAHFSYIRHFRLAKGSDKLNLFIGPAVNSFFTNKAPFGIGGISGVSIKLFNWLKFDTRYEITSTTNRLGLSLILNYK